MPTIGKKLKETRRSRGLSKEDVARATRIHRAVIARMEDDDFSQFPSVTYARSFLRQYGRHLGLDLEEPLAALCAREARFTEDALMTEMKRPLGPRRTFRRSLALLFARLRRPRLSRRGPTRPLLLNLLLILLMAAIGLFYLLGFHAPTPEQAREDIARVLGLPRPTATGGGIVPKPEAARPPTALDEEDPEAERQVPPSTVDPSGTAAFDPAPPGPPSLKKELVLEIDEAPPSLESGESNGPAPPGIRALPPMNLSKDEPSPPAPLAAPAIPKEEPGAALRPKGTDPATGAPRLPEPEKTTPSVRVLPGLPPPRAAAPDAFSQRSAILAQFSAASP